MAGDDDGKNNNDASSSSSSSGGSGGGGGPRLPTREQQQPAHEAPPAAPTGAGVNAATMAALQAQLAALASQQRAAARPPPSAGQHQKEKYAFWETQPVAQFGGGGGGEGGEGGEGEDDAPGPIDKPKTPEDVPAEPHPLPKGFRWCDVDVSLDSEIADVFDLLHKNYVEDDEEAFRFRYSPEFLKWALTPPGHVKEWHVGIRTDNAAGRLVGFITAVPATLLVRTGKKSGRGGDDTSSSSASASSSSSSSPSTTTTTPLRASEVNFLCVHKKLRSRRLAPVLIREVTRRVNRRGVWHAAYTAGVLLPRPVATARYWHRSLDARKLVDVGFCRVPPRVTMARYVKLHRLPEAPATPGLRPMRREDAAAVAALLAKKHLGGRFALAPEMSAEEVAHYLTPREGVVYSYVVEGAAGTAVEEEKEEEEEEEEEEGEGEEEEEEEDGEKAESASNSENAAASAAAASSAAASSSSAAAPSSQTQKKKRNKRKKKKRGSSKTITDLVSFYTLPSTVVGGRGGHDTLTAAFSFYSVAGTVSPKQLAGDALVLAKANGHDVFNALDIADNDEVEVLRALKFAPGDGRLRYYLYNWRMGGKELPAREIGLVLL